MYVLGKRSRERLDGLHPDLVVIVERAIEVTPVDFAVLEGGLQALLPSYSTLTLICALILALQLIANWWFGPVISPVAILLWAAYLFVLFLYPFIGLFLERASARLYLAMLLGLIYIGWRTLLLFKVRFGRRQVTWKRTPHGQKRQDP